MQPSVIVCKEEAARAVQARRSHSRRRIPDAERWKTPNDALIFLSAAKAALTVLTPNIFDFNPLLQLVPGGKVLFYDLRFPGWLRSKNCLELEGVI